MHACIPLYGLNRSGHSSPRRVNAGNYSTPRMHYPQRQNETASIVGLKNSHIWKHLIQNEEPIDTAGNPEDDEISP